MRSLSREKGTTTFKFGTESKGMKFGGQDMPGPGQYNDGNEFGKGGHGALMQGRSQERNKDYKPGPG